ncbi:hypothetical protein FB451DRAFT_1358693 [Mycena latifolia]|nr:hypothetical protein FB451DRAFT_1358693 [Mycena latifolia]
MAGLGTGKDLVPGTARVKGNKERRFGALLDFDHDSDGARNAPILRPISSDVDCQWDYSDWLLYEQGLQAQARPETSLADLPVELLISIFNLNMAASCRSTARSLVLVSPWISEVTLAARLAHISIRTLRELQSFHYLVCSSPRAAGAVRTLWILTNTGFYHEEAMIPDVLRACSNLHAVVCQVYPLAALCRLDDWFPMPPFRLTVIHNMRHPWAWDPGAQWKRILKAHHGTAFLQNLTHLHLGHYHKLDAHFPAADLPALTHLAMGKIWTDSEDDSEASISRYAARIRDFVRELDQLSLRLAAAVLVFWPVGRTHGSTGLVPALVKAARENGSHSNIMVCCPSNPEQELIFWEECVESGEDIWSLAQKQMSEEEEEEEEECITAEVPIRNKQKLLFLSHATVSSAEGPPFNIKGSQRDTGTQSLAGSIESSFRVSAVSNAGIDALSMTVPSVSINPAESSPHAFTKQWCFTMAVISERSGILGVVHDAQQALLGLDDDDDETSVVPRASVDDGSARVLPECRFRTEHQHPGLQQEIQFLMMVICCETRPTDVYVIASLSAELDSAQIPILEAERRKIQRNLRTLTFPILTLPVEVTSKIFIHCLPSRDDNSNLELVNFTPGPGDAPHLFLKICRQWRDIALGTRRLWASLPITDTDWGFWARKKTERQPGDAMLLRWISRAGSAPFFGAEIMSRAPQWHDATLVLEHRDLIDKKFSAQLCGRIPNLQRLHVHAWRQYNDGRRLEHENIPITAFEVAPTLTAVKLWHLTPSLIHLPWEQLTRFTADGLTTADCLQVLDNALSLVDCSFASIEGAEATPAPQDLVRPGLRSLTLSGSWSMCEDIISHLTSPALLTLGVWIGDDLEQLVSFLSRSRVALQALDLFSDYEGFTRVLPFMTGITSLMLKGIYHHEIMTILRSLRNSTTFLPHLRSINITVQNRASWYYGSEFSKAVKEVPDMDYEMLADALHARSGAHEDVARLELFRMVWLPTDPPDFFISRDHSTWDGVGFNVEELCKHLANGGTPRRLLDLVDEGMQVYIGTQYSNWVK